MKRVSCVLKWVAAAGLFGGTFIADVEAHPADQVNAADRLKNLELREIGPAVMGGRIDDFAVVESNPNIVFVGAASGGVWKTTNNGTTWTPVFDKESVSTIGDIAIAPSDSSVVWVGTGSQTIGRARHGATERTSRSTAEKPGRTWGFARRATLGAL